MDDNRKPDMSEKEILQRSDLGLDYEEALHGVQSVIQYEIENNSDYSEHTPKHLRTGVDARAADALGLVTLLIDKGVFTHEEYLEYVRLAMNVELSKRQDEILRRIGVPIQFR